MWGKLMELCCHPVCGPGYRKWYNDLVGARRSGGRIPVAGDFPEAYTPSMAPTPPPIQRQPGYYQQ